MNNEREEEKERKADILYTKVKTIFDSHTPGRKQDALLSVKKKKGRREKE